MKLLAAELAEQIRKKTADTLTRRMYVHVRGMPRRQEVEELHDSKKFKTALAQALADDKLYRDCIELNVQPGSLLVARYMEDEEAFDAVADNCTKKIISHARKYTVKKEKQFLSKYDINELIYEVKGRVKAEFIRNIKYHLLNDRLETINNYDNGGYWDDAWTGAVPVDPENYDDFAGPGRPRSSASGLMKYMSASLLMQRRSSQDLSKNVVIRTRSSVMKDRRLSYRISQNSSCPKNIYIIVRNISNVIDNRKIKKLSYEAALRWLIKHGYIYEERTQDQIIRHPTNKGTENRIILDGRPSSTKGLYYITYYPPSI